MLHSVNVPHAAHFAAGRKQLTVPGQELGNLVGAFPVVLPDFIQKAATRAQHRLTFFSTGQPRELQFQLARRPAAYQSIYQSRSGLEVCHFGSFASTLSSTILLILDFSTVPLKRSLSTGSSKTKATGRMGAVARSCSLTQLLSDTTLRTAVNYGPTLVGTIPQHHDLDRPREHVQIQPQRPVANIVQIQIHALFVGGVIAA